ncbi:c-type cytochrome [Flavobacterium sp. Sd200]|uniref:c-type cytochrome n=1 Tax=Flavobacterium sp. Sd200 TaxID=2692211 RepID=UPI0013715FAC|nr:c-type cytochrome [Flavobacterium sp. Sd200]MXN92734.1 c-type cytochrome [Flavobacterium sp. Sd200]
MKQLLTLLTIITLFSCKKEETKNTAVDQNTTVSEGSDPSASLSAEAKLGQEIFDGKGNCFSCHKPDQKIVGPSIQEIAKMYADKKGNMVNFLLGESEPIVDPSQYDTMKANIYLTKNFSEEELKGLEAYFMSFLPK